VTTTGTRVNLWRARDFLITWSAQVVSRIGTQISTFVLPLLVLEVTGSAGTAGALAALERAPYLVLALLAGALVERWDKRVVMLAGNSIRAVLFGLLAGYLLAGGDDIGWVAAIVLTSGVVYVFYDAANGTVLPQILPPRELTRASGWLEGTTALTEVIGPALGGMLLGLGATTIEGAGYAFGVDALTYVACGLAVLFLRTSLRPVASDGPRASLLASMRDGVRHVLRHVELRRLAVTNFVNVMVFGTVPLAFMSLSRTEFSLDSAHIGYLLALGSLSGVLGSFCSGYLSRRLGTYGLMLTAGVCWAAGELLLAVAPAVWTAAVALVLVLWVAPPYFAAVYARRMSIIPRELLTRVNSIYRFLSQAGIPLGLLLAGLLIETVGPRTYLAAAAATFLAVAILTRLTAPAQASSASISSLGVD